MWCRGVGGGPLARRGFDIALIAATSPSVSNDAAQPILELSRPHSGVRVLTWAVTCPYAPRRLHHKWIDD